MSKTKPKKLRVQTELSQPYVMPPKKAKQVADLHQRLRDQANRIHDLEEQIAKLSRGSKGTSLSFEVSVEVMEILVQLRMTGFYGITTPATAALLLTEKVRSEMAWLATGKAS